MSPSDIIKALADSLFRRLPLKNTILFESLPAFSDNTIMVYNELVRRGLDKKYKMIWICDEKSSGGFKCVSVNDKLRFWYYCYTAKLMISGNQFIEKRKDKQYYLHLSHGAALKDCSGHYNLPDCVDNALSFSDYMAKYDAVNYCCNADKMLSLGYPRNDVLLSGSIELHKYFGACEFDKAICWMPTYRQLGNGLVNCSSISMPIIHDEDTARKINDFAKKRRVLIITKPHPRQDVSGIVDLGLSNIVFIDNAFLEKNGIDNYALLGACDALLTDYSSVYYDYLLTDKPIGLCWDDFEEYNSREGFTVDPKMIMAGGEKIYNGEDMIGFIDRISKDEDVLADKRNEIKRLVHAYHDGCSTKRVADFIEKKLQSI